MYIIDKLKQLKIILVVLAIIIVCVSLWISHYLIKDLAIEETNKMEVWAEALRAINKAGDDDLTLVLRVLYGNNTIPVIVLDKNDEIQTYRNIPITSKDTVAFLNKKAMELKKVDRKIRIYLDDVNEEELTNEDEYDYVDIYYEDSLLLKRLASFPYVQLAVVFIFVMVTLFALLSSKRAEQNKVWVGLSKETAHQLGTPISSLMAWMEILIGKYSQDELLPEMAKDVNRLQIIADRFSKIGSMPEPMECDINEVIQNVTNYISLRVSSKVKFNLNLPDHPVFVKLNTSLFEWVIENLYKNAIDAMEGHGSIDTEIVEIDNKVYIEISDTGKGIAKSKYKAVFTPGYTTKRRGWGLGLSLAKRIVEEYHNGKIYVKKSEINKGTTFRIEVKRQ